MHKAERGLFELQRGRPVLFVSYGRTPANGGPPDGAGATQPVLAIPAESVQDASLATLARLGCGPARLVVTHHRSRAMALPVEGDASFRLGDAPAAEILALAGSGGKAGAAGESPGPVREPRPATPTEVAGLELARLGRLLPAVVVVPADPGRGELRHAIDAGRILVVALTDVEELEARASVEIVAVSDAPVPLEETEDAHFMLFRETPSMLEHVAIVIGAREAWPDPVPVRLHSACLTGDLFGSLRCDCGEQLHGSLRHFAERGGGILLYLAQEGRGIGLGNKLRAYTIQEDGLDTIEADAHLGFGPDERRYEAALKILEHLGITRVELLTNNPEKVRAVENAGIEVVARRAIHGTLNRHNRPYVETKVTKTGHWLASMLADGGEPGG